MIRIILLGTGDLCNEERAQSALALPLPSGETVLLDASSGTILLRQLQRAGIGLESIRHVFISHCHFDHVGGLAPLLTRLVPLPTAAVTIYAPPTTGVALRRLLALTLPGVEDWLGERLTWCDLQPDRPVRASDLLVTPVPVDHGVECVGFRLTQGGTVAAFSADTRPTPALVDMAEGADLLIHEAYGGEQDAAAAHAFGHATAADAGRVAHAAGVRHLLLTHVRARRFVDPAVLEAQAVAAGELPVRVAADLDVIEL
jgi:ribonuclease BN (tRNA processing enzyme)